MGLGAPTAYRAGLDDLNDDVIEGDLLAQTVLQYAVGMEPGAQEPMTSAEWLHLLTRLYSGEDCRPLPKGWPTTGKVLSGRLKRLQPTLPGYVDGPHRSVRAIDVPGVSEREGPIRYVAPRPG